MSEMNMAEYLDLFLQEADEQVEILEQETLKLEQDPSKERLQIIFRAAHTLKGSSRAMGFQNMAELTHQVENVLDMLRNDQLEISTQIADALLNGLDSFMEMIEKIKSTGKDEVDCAELVVRLQDIASGSSNALPAPVATSTSVTESHSTHEIDPHIAQALAISGKECPVFHGKFRLTSDCAMKYVRVFMILAIIQEEGELLHAVPSAEDLEEEHFDQDFELYFQSTSSLEMVEKKLSGVGEVESYSVAAWSIPEAKSQEVIPTTETQTEASKPVEVAATPSSNAPAKRTESGQTVRVDVARMDSLMNLVGELVIDRTRIAQIGADLASKFTDTNIDALAECVGHIARITSDLQDQIMKARMMPIDSVFNRFPRVVRDLAQKLGKDVKLELAGGETELDRSVIEVIGDPLLHILRNSVDHGIEMPEDRLKAGKPEQGVVLLSAWHQENHIVIQIKDDGKGIDVARVKRKAVEAGTITQETADRMSERDALQLIFASGLSTAEEVSEVSGRGVGMDIVRSNLQKLGGLIDLETELGVGSKFTLRLPLTLAIIRGLLVNVEKVVYVVPLGSVIETLLVKKSSIEQVNHQEVIVIRGVTTPLVRLRSVFNLRHGKTSQSTENISQEEYVVIVGMAEKRIGLVVDSLIGEQEVVIKSLSRYCGDIQGVSGATILGDGNVALIMDVNGLLTTK